MRPPVLEAIAGKEVIAFHGDMGSGKTTFIHALCEVKGVKDVVGSPTFSIINEYYFPGWNRVYHIDLYRLKDEQEAITSRGGRLSYTVIIFVLWNGLKKLAISC